MRLQCCRHNNVNFENETFILTYADKLLSKKTITLE